MAKAKEPAPGRELAPDERVLTVDPEYAKPGKITYYDKLATERLTPWEVEYTKGAVSFATIKLDGKDTPALVTKWDPTWGQIPAVQTVPLIGLDSPIALARAQALGGWELLRTNEQHLIANLLGGPQTWIAANARDALRPKYKKVKSKNHKAQAKALRDVKGKDAEPEVAHEKLVREGVDFELDGPHHVDNYAFEGKTQAAERWQAKYDDRDHLPIIAPKKLKKGLHGHSVKQAAQAASYLSKGVRTDIKKIQLNPITNPADKDWAEQYDMKDFHSYMTAGKAGIVTIFPDKKKNDLPEEQDAAKSLIHETGHTWSFKHWGEDTKKGKWKKWKKAMHADKVSVSQYARADIAEDVAETIQVFVSTRGTERYDEYMKLVPHRFKILEREYK